MLTTVQQQIAEARRSTAELTRQEVKQRVVFLFQQWAMTHPDETVRDELWGFVMKIREEL